MASELGLPAIVGVERACELIKDGQEIEIDPVSGVVMIH
jgi:phosphohistidine swiveling domain-containing protein